VQKKRGETGRYSRNLLVLVSGVRIELLYFPICVEGRMEKPQNTACLYENFFIKYSVNPQISKLGRQKRRGRTRRVVRRRKRRQHGRLLVLIPMSLHNRSKALWRNVPDCFEGGERTGGHRMSICFTKGEANRQKERPDEGRGDCQG